MLINTKPILITWHRHITKFTMHTCHATLTASNLWHNWYAANEATAPNDCQKSLFQVVLSRI